MSKSLLAAVIALALLSLNPRVAPVSAQSTSGGALHVTKECSQDKGNAGDFCTITSTNLDQIAVGSRVYYDQAAGVPAGLLDSNVVLDAGNGDRAIGHCTLDLGTGLGLCNFSDGIGQFAGFSARVTVTCTMQCIWDGTYSFNPPPATK